MSIFERRVEYSQERFAVLGREAKGILARDVFYDAIEEAEINFLEIMQFAESADERETARCSAIALTGVIKELRRIQADGELAEEVLRRRAETE